MFYRSKTLQKKIFSSAKLWYITDFPNITISLIVIYEF